MAVRCAGRSAARRGDRYHGVGEMSREPFTIGIEEEYQIIDPETRELRSYIQEFLEQGQVILQDQIKPEFLQSQVEVGSRICRSMAEARAEIVRLRRSVVELADANGLWVAAASTHPFSSWASQEVTAGARYTKLHEQMVHVARQMLIFGTHVHIGIEDKELLIDVMNQARYFLPHVLALSTSSPFWDGRDTGMKSYRSIIFENLPRTGLPPSFSSFAEYDTFVNTLVGTNCIEDPSKIWWDIRPHHTYPTLEFRFMDICTRVDELMCVASILLAVVAKLIRLRRSNQSWRRYRHHLITENKWRAVRWGIEGDLIDFGRKTEVPMRNLVEEMLELVDDVLDDLGIRREVEYVHTILRNGTSADRQLAAYENSGNLRDVVEHVVRETREGLDGRAS